MIDHAQARLELAARAGAARRANRPAGLVAAAAVVFLVALVYLLWGLGNRAAARARASAAREKNQAIQMAVTRLRSTIAEADSKRTEEQTRKSDLIIANLEQLAEELGVQAATVSDASSARPDPSAELTRKQYRCSLRDQPIGPILSWLVQAPSRIPGIEVSTLNITPSAQPAQVPTWNADVTFVRWERKN